MKPTYTRRRRPPAHREAVAFKKESQQEPSFFGQTGHAPFFQPAVAMTQTGIRRKCAGCEAEVKAQRKEKAQEQETVQRAPVKEEEKLQRMEANKEKEEKVQRMTGAKEEEKVQRAVEEKKEETVQKKEAGPSAAPPHTASAYIGGIHGKGQPFSSATRQFYEKRMGADFGNVRIHTDPDAAASAKEINARAYTYGHHIVFNEDQYRPETSDGGHLLAHELAHVVQQSGKTANKAFRLPGPGGEETVHAGMAESYRERRGVPASGRGESGLAVGPSDWEIIHRLAPSIARLVQELRTAYSTGGTAALFARMRTLTPLQRLEPELADFVAVTLVGNELWAANLLLRYGPETAWPARWRVRRELLLLPGGGGAAQAMAALGSASEAEKIAIINDSVTMDLMRALNATARQQLGAALINLGAVPTGSAQNATAELLLSSVVIERNTALRIANGDIRIFYMENLTHAANEAAILASMGLNPAQFAVYNYPDGSPNTVNVQLNAIGFRINGANIICGQRALDISRWRTLLIHETNHARNPSPVTPLDNYQVEFRAYWLAEFSNVADLADRARQIKAHILRDYALIRAAYDNDATVRAAIDAHTRPVGNLTNE